MTDTDKLKRLAEFHFEVGGKIAHDAEEVATPILALIAENEQLNVDLVEWEIDYRTAKAERDGAVALLRECLNQPMEPWGKVSAFLARIDAKDSE